MILYCVKLHLELTTVLLNYKYDFLIRIYLDFLI